MNTKVWLWNWVILKSVATMAGAEIVMEAVEIDEDPEFTEADFAWPEDIELSESVQNMLDQYDGYKKPAGK